MTVHVMMPDVSSAAALDAADQLRAAGHQVHACHQPHEHGFACSALRGRGCPLEAFPVDVVVNVRSTTDERPTLAEDGAICGVRRRIPLVVAGDTRTNPFASWTSTEIEGTDVLPAVAVASSMPMPHHSRVATDVLLQTIAQRGENAFLETARAEVRRAGGRLQVTLSVVPPMQDDTGRMAAVHVTQALRDYDRWAGGIDVRVD